MKETKWSDFPGEEYQKRWHRASSLMAKQGIDALLLTQMENVRYFSGFLSQLWCSKFRPMIALLPQDPSSGASLILPGSENGNSITSWVDEVIFYGDQVDPLSFITDLLKKKQLHSGTIGAELGFGQRLGMPYAQFEELKSSLGSARFVNASRLIQDARMIKSPAEIECLKKACELSQKGVAAGWESLREGMTERELMAIILSDMYRRGAEPGITASQFAIRAGYHRNRNANALASNSAIKSGDFVVVDGGACYQGYVCDFIRQAFVGHPSKDQLSLYNLVVQAVDSAIAAIRPGLTAADVYEAAMKVFADAGLSRYSQYNIVGHGLGLDIHELPWLGERNVVYTWETILQPGMCLTVEPILSGLKDLKGTPDPNQETGRFIVEDVVVVTESGCENLTATLKNDLWVV
jgi:Xaa-Pro aminopeptidase